MCDPHINQQTKENCDRFKLDEIAKKYPTEYREGHGRDQREKNAILRCVNRISSDAHVLDFPCGAGRLIKLIQGAGLEVSGADASASMVEIARNNCNDTESKEDSISFYVSDVFDSKFADDEFDAVFSNRLFHHFNEGSDRTKALQELARISKGPVVVSFFNSCSVSTLFKRISKAIRGKKMNDRVPIPISRIVKEAESVGLHVLYKTACCWGISPHWYIIFSKSPA